MLIDDERSGNLIGTSGQDGSDDVLERNVISGNHYTAVILSGEDTTDNVVAGNYLGTTASGEAALGNGPGGDGVDIVNGASANWVGVNPVSGGPENADQGNLISGNSDGGAGVWIDPTSFGNVVAGNLIGAECSRHGCDWRRMGRLHPGLLESRRHDRAERRQPDARAPNVISGNSQIGVDITGSSATGNVVAGNYIGTTASGTAAPGNASDGVRIESGADENWIGVNSVSGGPDNADQGNVISANGNDGVYIYAPCEGNVIAGDFIGTDASGQNALGNHNNGIGVGSSTSVYAQNNVIGIPGYGNVISGNISTDILVYYSVGTVIQANRIGTTADGMHVIQASGAIPVSYNDCVQIDDSPDTLVGGTVPGTGNLISMGPWSSSYLPYAGPLGGVLWGTNGVDVIDLSTSPGSAGTVIVGNLIGTVAAGTNVLGNPFFGVSLSTSPASRSAARRRSGRQCDRWLSAKPASDFSAAISATLTLVLRTTPLKAT